jgi:hypothetical protein
MPRCAEALDDLNACQVVLLPLRWQMRNGCGQTVEHAIQSLLLLLLVMMSASYDGHV